MGNPSGFLKFTRQVPANRPVDERIKDHKEFSKDDEFGDPALEWLKRPGMKIDQQDATVVFQYACNF